MKGMEGNKDASGSGEIESEKTGDDQEVTAAQSFVRTRAQKRKLSFKENREMEVSISLMTSLLYIQIKHSFFLVLLTCVNGALALRMNGRRSSLRLCHRLVWTRNFVPAWSLFSLFLSLPATQTLKTSSKISNL